MYFFFAPGHTSTDLWRKELRAIFETFFIFKTTKKGGKRKEEVSQKLLTVAIALKRNDHLSRMLLELIRESI